MRLRPLVRTARSLNQSYRLEPARTDATGTLQYQSMLEALRDRRVELALPFPSGLQIEN